MSVDSQVWPSTFETLPGLERPDWTGYVQDLWESFDDLATTLRTSPDLDLNQVDLIAVELVPASAALLTNWRERVVQVLPSQLGHLGASLAGYDVADYFLLSGLTNCNAPLWTDAKQWAPLLNQDHLFTTADCALRFKAEADKHVPEHAPFFVFALWLLKLPRAIAA